jgi:hypothetical protein
LFITEYELESDMAMLPPEVPDEDPADVMAKMAVLINDALAVLYGNTDNTMFLNPYPVYNGNGEWAWDTDQGYTWIYNDGRLSMVFI